GDGGMLLRSTDGGRTWRRQTSGTAYALSGVACPNASTCVAVGGTCPPAITCAAVGAGSTLLRSTDGGRTWSSQPYPLSGTATCLRGAASLRAALPVVGGGGTLLRSTDGGRTWRRQPSGTTTSLFGVACPSPSTCVVVGGDTL